jgi:hypothetical protein
MKAIRTYVSQKYQQNPIQYIYACRIARTAVDIAEHERFSANCDITRAEKAAWLHSLAEVNNIAFDLPDFIANNVTTRDDVNQFYLLLRLISHQREIAYNESYANYNEYVKKLLGANDAIIRDIVSDAIHCESLGYNGICKLIDAQIPDDELKSYALQKANEYNLRIKDEFIKTRRGNEIAKPLHYIFAEHINNIDYFIEKRKYLRATHKFGCNVNDARS